MDETILVERDGPIATVVLNRPEKLNALTRAMWQRLGEAVERAVGRRRRALHRDPRCRREGVFAGQRHRASSQRERSNKAQAIEYGEVMHRTAEALADCRHPLVAQIHGICVGGGLEIAALCDLRICGESSRFGAPIKNLGLVMAYAEMAPLVRLVGAARRARDPARRPSLRRRRRRRRRGSSRASSPDDAGRRRGARDRASASPRARRWSARWHKKFARRLADRSPLTAAERDECFDCFDTEDFRIGYAAFLAKRKAALQGPLRWPMPDKAARSARGHARARARADHGRADRGDDAGRHGRRRHQGREAAGRRRRARLPRAAASTASRRRS